MGSISQAQYELMRARVMGPGSLTREDDRENKLREKIIEYCNAKWPRWKLIWARSDKKSTLPVGVHDLTIFMPDAYVMCIELKSKYGKQSTEQLAWANEMEKLRHYVRVVRTFEEFIELVGDK